jgi:Leucine-rich repeat (LRR) protein
VSKNNALITLACSNNQLTSLDVSKNNTLITLECNNNQLTTLDVSKNTVLRYLSCDRNQLISIDLSKNTDLNEFTATKQTPTLTLSSSDNHYHVAIELNNPAFDNAGITYANGKLTSKSPEITQSDFKVETGYIGFSNGEAERDDDVWISGTLKFKYKIIE